MSACHPDSWLKSMITECMDEQRLRKWKFRLSDLLEIRNVNNRFILQFPFSSLFKVTVKVQVWKTPWSKIKKSERSYLHDVPIFHMILWCREWSVFVKQTYFHHFIEFNWFQPSYRMHRKNVTTNQGKIRFFVISSKVAQNFIGVWLGDQWAGIVRESGGIFRKLVNGKLWILGRMFEDGQRL